MLLSKINKYCTVRYCTHISTTAFAHPTAMIRTVLQRSNFTMEEETSVLVVPYVPGGTMNARQMRLAATESTLASPVVLHAGLPDFEFPKGNHSQKYNSVT